MTTSKILALSSLFGYVREGFIRTLTKIAVGKVRKIGSNQIKIIDLAIVRDKKKYKKKIKKESKIKFKKILIFF